MSKGKGKNVKYGFSAPSELVNQIDKVAHNLQMNRSEFIRFLFHFWLQEAEIKKIGGEIAIK